MLKFNFFVRVLIHLCAEARERKKEREAAKKLQNKVETFASLAKIPKLAAEKERERRRGWRRGSGAATSRKAARKILNRIKMHSSSNDTDTAKKKRAKSGQEQQAERQRGGVAGGWLHRDTRYARETAA